MVLSRLGWLLSVAAISGAFALGMFVDAFVRVMWVEDRVGLDHPEVVDLVSTQPPIVDVLMFGSGGLALLAFVSAALLLIGASLTQRRAGA
ncbi:MAG: hypothetical protein Q4G46_02725 [Propionibacteriaceae bacterium]|nr:hypothetical protein [Propionibacteriaceae bacterium]